MGMFDSVMVPCPKCTKLVEFQSKAGECNLSKYHVNSVPAEIAVDINGDTENCENCGYLIKLSANVPRISMQVTNETEEDLWD